MIQVCAWCKTTIRDLGGEAGKSEAPGPLDESGRKTGRSDKETSDGICLDCRKEFFPETLRSVREQAAKLVASPAAKSDLARR